MRPRAWFVVFSFLALTFSSRVLSAADAQVLPAGTAINVRTTQLITADSAQVGMRLNGVVDNSVVVGRRTVIPRGAGATLEVTRVERSTNLKGRDRIGFQLRSIHVGGRSYAVATNNVEFRGHSEGKRAAQKIGIGAGAGGVLGGILGGGTGAALGAITGGATGAVISGSNKQHLVVPAESLLQFRLSSQMWVNR